MSNTLKCPTSPLHGTTIEQKLKSKRAAYNFKHGSPKLRDILHEKCRIRVKEARSSTFQDRRNLPKSFIARILREEVAELEMDIELQELIYNELIQQADEWLNEAFENEQNAAIDLLESEIIFCPICQISGLRQNQNSLLCDCGIKFIYNGTLHNFKQQIDKIISEHEIKCDNLLNFFIEPNELKPDSSTLNSFCAKCDRFVVF